MADDSPKSPSIGQRLGIAALMFSVSALLSRVLGLVRNMLVANYFGAGLQSDAYEAAFMLPDMMSYFLTGGTLSITFIPLFSAFVSRGDEAGGWRLYSTIATVMGGTLAVATLVAWIAAPKLVPLLAPEYGPQKMALTIEMTRIVLPAQMAFFLGGLTQATLFVKERFWPAAVSPLVYSVCIILGGVLLHDAIGIKGFSWGAALGALLGPLGVPLFAARKEIRFRPSLAVRSEGFRRFIVLSLPLIVGATLISTDIWLMQRFSSDNQGAITRLQYARQLMMSFSALIGQAVGMAALPFLSKLFDEGKIAEMGALISNGLQRIAFLSVVAAAILAATSRPLVYAIYQRGSFTPAAANQTSLLLVIFCFGLTSWTMQALAVRGFYARQDTKTPMILGVLVLALCVPIYWFLDNTFGPPGLAAASGIGITLNLSAILLTYKRRVGHLPLGNVALGFLKGLGCAAAGGAAAWTAGYFTLPMLNLERTWHAVGAGAIEAAAFCLVVGVILALARPEEFEPVRVRIARKLGRA